jgi:hypothetical protein
LILSDLRVQSTHVPFPLTFIQRCVTPVLPGQGLCEAADLAATPQRSDVLAQQRHDTQTPFSPFPSNVSNAQTTKYMPCCHTWMSSQRCWNQRCRKRRRQQRWRRRRR